MIFDIGASEGSPERMRALCVRTVLVNGVDVTDHGWIYADTATGEMRRVKDTDGRLMVERDAHGKPLDVRVETVRIDPKALRLVPKSECPTGLRW